MGQRLKSCTILAPQGADVATLARALSQRQVRVETKFGADARTLKPAFIQINKPDLAIGILKRERSSDWILFELGQYWLAGSQVVIFAPVNLALAQLTDKKGVLVVRVGETNSDAIAFVLEQLTAVPEPDWRESPQPEEKLRALGDQAKVLFDAASNPSKELHETQIHKIVEHLLRASGVEALAVERAYGASGGSSNRADFAVWCDAFEGVIGNPLLIEVRASAVQRREARGAGLQLFRQVMAAGTATGLVIYGRGSKATDDLMPPNILSISISELLEQIETKAFTTIVLDLRNARAHKATS